MYTLLGSFPGSPILSILMGEVLSQQPLEVLQMHTLLGGFLGSPILCTHMDVLLQHLLGV